MSISFLRTVGRHADWTDVVDIVFTERHVRISYDDVRQRSIRLCNCPRIALSATMEIPIQKSRKSPRGICIDERQRMIEDPRPSCCEKERDTRGTARL